LFLTGLVLGWHHSTLTERLARFPRRPALGVSAGLFAALVLFDRYSDRLALLIGGTADRATDVKLFLLEVVFAKGDVRPGRIIASIVVFGFFYLLVTECWRPISRALGWFLLPLGQSALYAYAAHVVLAVPIGLLL